MIQVEGLSYRYPGSEENVLQDINLNVAAGEFCGIVGPNEAGKSTLCYTLTGFIPHFYHGSLSGQVVVGEKNITETPLGELAGDIALVFQNSFNQITGSRFSVREEVAFGLENLGLPREEIIDRVEWSLDLMGLGELSDRSPFALSGGQQQRLALASMLAMRPRLLVLDEPTSQLDPAGTRDLFEALGRMVQEEQLTVVLVEYKLEWMAGFCDRVLLLEEGRIVADGPPNRVFTSTKLERIGIQSTRYTRAARLTRESGLISSEPNLPITLDQAVEIFR
jgi:energy-coupling factor transporter ATP-binding protein EcfA2